MLGEWQKRHPACKSLFQLLLEALYWGAGISLFLDTGCIFSKHQWWCAMHKLKVVRAVARSVSKSKHLSERKMRTFWTYITTYKDIFTQQHNDAKHWSGGFQMNRYTKNRVRTNIKILFFQNFPGLQRPNSRVFQDLQNSFLTGLEITAI